MDIASVLLDITGIAVALAGFTGVVVAFGSRSNGTWDPGDRLRLGFMMEASLTAGGFSLLALALLSTNLKLDWVWKISSGGWVAFMLWSLYSSHTKIKQSTKKHEDIDKLSNRIVLCLFLVVVALQIVNILLWSTFSCFLIALISNVVGSAMQFARLIFSAFHE